MNKKLYGGYKEFAEVDMKLEKWLDTGIDEAEAKAEAKAEKRFASKLNRMVKAMKAGGESVSKIMRYTGLSRREIAAL